MGDGLSQFWGVRGPNLSLLTHTQHCSIVKVPFVKRHFNYSRLKKRCQQCNLLVEASFEGAILNRR